MHRFDDSAATGAGFGSACDQHRFIGVVVQDATEPIEVFAAERHRDFFGDGVA
jgi:hypothetical protein